MLFGVMWLSELLLQLSCSVVAMLPGVSGSCMQPCTLQSKVRMMMPAILVLLTVVCVVSGVVQRVEVVVLVCVCTWQQRELRR